MQTCGGCHKQKAPRFPSPFLFLKVSTCLKDSQPVGNCTHDPVWEVSRWPQSSLIRLKLPITFAIYTNTCTRAQKRSGPCSKQPLLLAGSAIITHSEWLWKVYSFLKSNKNNRVTITASDVAVSFHCVSSSSGLFFFSPVSQWHSCSVYRSCLCERTELSEGTIRFYPHVINVQWPAETKSRLSASASSSQKYCSSRPTMPCSVLLRVHWNIWLKQPVSAVAGFFLLPASEAEVK